MISSGRGAEANVSMLLAGVDHGSTLNVDQRSPFSSPRASRIIYPMVSDTLSSYRNMWRQVARLTFAEEHVPPLLAIWPSKNRAPIPAFSPGGTPQPFL